MAKKKSSAAGTMGTVDTDNYPRLYAVQLVDHSFPDWSDQLHQTAQDEILKAPVYVGVSAIILMMYSAIE